MSSATWLEGGLDGTVRDRQQELVRFVEYLWDKYQVPLDSIQADRNLLVSKINNIVRWLGYR